MIKGFTMLEFLVVLSIAGVFVAISAGVYSSLRQQNNVELASREAQSVLNLAREQTIASEGDQNFGVYINNTDREYFIFPGPSYVQGGADNKKFVVPGNVNILAPQFKGGGN